jgi:anti-sigma-K factor RskA
MTPDELQALCALYVLGALEPHAAADLEARLQAGELDVVREVQALREVVDLLPYALTPLPPPPTVRAQLMARLNAAPPEATPGGTATSTSRRLPARFRTPLFWLPTAAAALLALVLGWSVYDLRQQVITLEAHLQQLQHVAGEHERLFALLTSPTVTMVTLTGTPHAPDAGARLLWDTRRGEWTVIADGLPLLPAGKTYQLWLLTAGAPMPSETFHLDSHQRGVIQTRLPANPPPITGAAVSLEPEGGVPQPTGAIVLVAQFYSNLNNE